MLRNFSSQETREGKYLTTENKPSKFKKAVIRSYMSIIILNVNGLNAPSERHRLAEQMKTCIYALPLTTSLCLTCQTAGNYFILSG